MGSRRVEPTRLLCTWQAAAGAACLPLDCTLDSPRVVLQQHTPAAFSPFCTAPPSSPHHHSPTPFCRCPDGTTLTQDASGAAICAAETCGDGYTLASDSTGSGYCWWASRGSVLRAASSRPSPLSACPR